MGGPGDEEGAHSGLNFGSGEETQRSRSWAGAHMAVAAENVEEGNCPGAEHRGRGAWHVHWHEWCSAGAAKAP